MAGLGALAYILQGIGGLGEGVASSADAARKQQLAQIEQQRADALQAYQQGLLDLDRQKLEQAKLQNPLALEAFKRQQQAAQGGQVAEALGLQIPVTEGPRPEAEMQGPMPGVRNIPPRIAALQAILRSGLVEKPGELVAQEFPKPDVREITDPGSGNVYLQPFNPQTGEPIPGAARTLKEQGGMATLRQMFGLGGGGGEGDASTAPGGLAAPGARMTAPPGYELPDVSVKLPGGLSVTMKPQDVNNAYTAAAYFGSNGRTMNVQDLTPAERPAAEAMIREFQTRSPDMYAASLLQSGDPAKIALANGFQAVQARREANTAAAVTTARTAAEPLSEQAQNALQQQTKVLTNIRQLKGFSPEEIASYVGLLNTPVQEIKQKLAGMGMADADTRYNQFKIVMGNLNATAFGEGGKNLTPTELHVVQAYTPNGSEPNAEAIRQKVMYLEAATAAARDLRAQLQTQGRANVSPAEMDAMYQQALQKAGVPTPQEAPGWSGTPRLGEPGYTGVTNKVTRGSAPVGKILLEGADGSQSYWPANKAIPPGARRID